MLNLIYQLPNGNQHTEQFLIFRTPANAGAGAGGGGNVGDVRRRAWRSAEKPAHARGVCQVRRPQPGVADDDPVGGTLAGGLPDGEDTVPGLGEESPGVRAGERA